MSDATVRYVRSYDDLAAALLRPERRLDIVLLADVDLAGHCVIPDGRLVEIRGKPGEGRVLRRAVSGDLFIVTERSALALRDVTVDGMSDVFPDAKGALVAVLPAKPNAARPAWEKRLAALSAQERAALGRVLLFDGASLASNATSGPGGAVRIATQRGQLGMYGSASILQCEARLGGGVAALDGGHVALRGSAIIANCAASDAGGGVYLFAKEAGTGALTLSDTAAIAYCKAAQGGGAYLENASLDCCGDARVQHNHALGGTGGGLYLTAPKHLPVTANLRENAAVSLNRAASPDGWDVAAPPGQASGVSVEDTVRFTRADESAAPPPPGAPPRPAPPKTAGPRGLFRSLPMNEPLCRGLAPPYAPYRQEHNAPDDAQKAQIEKADHAVYADHADQIRKTAETPSEPNAEWEANTMRQALTNTRDSNQPLPGAGGNAPASQAGPPSSGIRLTSAGGGSGGDVFRISYDQWNPPPQGAFSAAAQSEPAPPAQRVPAAAPEPVYDVKSRAYTMTIKQPSMADPRSVTAVTQLPTVPTPTGYRFEGWYTDEALTEKVNSRSLTPGRVNVWAKWVSLTPVSYAQPAGRTALEEPEAQPPQPRLQSKQEEAPAASVAPAEPDEQASMRAALADSMRQATARFRKQAGLPDLDLSAYSDEEILSANLSELAMRQPEPPPPPEPEKPARQSLPAGAKASNASTAAKAAQPEPFNLDPNTFAAIRQDAGWSTPPGMSGFPVAGTPDGMNAFPEMNSWYQGASGRAPVFSETPPNNDPFWQSQLPPSLFAGTRPSAQQTPTAQAAYTPAAATAYQTAYPSAYAQAYPAAYPQAYPQAYAQTAAQTSSQMYPAQYQAAYPQPQQGYYADPYGAQAAQPYAQYPQAQTPQPAQQGYYAQPARAPGQGW